MNPPPTSAPSPRGGRQQLRSLKRQVRRGAAPDASPGQREQSRHIALALLERSMRFGHRRLAVQRLCEAVGLGVSLHPGHWSYCEGVVAESADPLLRTRFQAARRQHA